nr:hypothetical protein [Providencia stuartii]
MHNPVGWVDPFGLSGCCNKFIATLKNIPKNNPPKPHQLETMNKAINDIFNGKGIPRINRETGTQTIFQGIGNAAQTRWKGALEWEVISGNNNLRVLTKDLGNGKTQIGFSNDHYIRIFDVVIKQN